MILMLLVGASFSQPPVRSDSIELCKAALARKSGGQIQNMTITSTTTSRSGTTSRGRLTIFVGAPSAPAGSANPHHLIRAGYGFECLAKHGRIRRIKLTQPWPSGSWLSSAMRRFFAPNWGTRPEN